MIIVDTGIWVDHLRAGNDRLAGLGEQLELLLHPYVLAELALGSLSRRDWLLGRMALMPQPPVARAADVLRLIDAELLSSTGIGYVDAHLLASTRLLPGGRLWTRDSQLLKQAHRLGVAYAP